MTELSDAINRAKARWGDKFDSSSIDEVDASIRARFGGRVILRRTYTADDSDTRYGRIGITTGWRPSLLLVGRDSNSGSSDLIGARDELIAFHNGKHYVNRRGERIKVAAVDAHMAW